MAGLNSKLRQLTWRTANRTVFDFSLAISRTINTISAASYSKANALLAPIVFDRSARSLLGKLAVGKYSIRLFFKRAAFIAIASSVVAPAYSAQLWCRGKITNSYVDSSGTLIIAGTWRGDYTQLCNIAYSAESDR